MPDSHAVSETHAGWRLDRFLAELPSVGSRRRAREALSSGKVTVEGTTATEEDGGRTLPLGATVVIDWNRPGSGREWVAARGALVESGLKILWEDHRMLFVEKPPGLLTDAATEEQRRERDTATQRVRVYLRPQGKQAFVVHRIDRDTSGVLLFAKDEAAQTLLKTQFEAREPERVYLALLQGVPSPASGTWIDDMVWDGHQLIQRVPRHANERGTVRASAHYKVLETLASGCALVEVRLVTGRRNQIRLHAMLRNVPLVGERLYNPRPWTPIGPNATRQWLHAHRLGVRHPETQERIAVESPIPPDLTAILGNARKRPRPRSG